MKKIIFALLVLVLLVSCAPAQKAPEAQKAPVTPPVQEPAKTEVKEEKITTPSAPVEAAPPAQATGIAVDIRAACKNIIAPEDFSRICGVELSRTIVDAKETEHSCWVTFIDRMDRKYTAGFTTVDWLKASEADREFQRGIDMRRKEAETDVGEKNYKYSEIGRENIVWLRGSFLTRIGASTELCTKEKLAELAQFVDNKLK